jgi:hypothetical protein
LGGVIKGLNKEFVKESAELAIVFNKLKSATKGSKEHKAAIDQINKVYGKYLPNLLTEKSSLEDIAAAQNLANDALTKNIFLKIQSATRDDIITNKLTKQIAAFKGIKESIEAQGQALDGSSAQFRQLIEGLQDSSSEINKAFTAIKGNRFAFDPINEGISKTDKSLGEFLASINELSGDVRLNFIDSVNKAKNSTRDFNKDIKEAEETVNDISASIVTYDHSVNTNTSSLNKNTEAQKANSAERLAAIEAVQAALEKSEIENIEDKQARLLALEELRFIEEQNLKELQFIEDSKLLQGHEDELLALQKFNDGLGEQQEIAHQQKLAAIKEQFNKETAEITPIDLQAEGLKKQEALFDEEVKLVEEKNEKIEESNDKLFSNISKSAAKVGALIVDLYKKSADLAGDRVEEQQSNLENAEQRQRDGLETNLAFERQQLAKKESEQLAAQKRAEDAAKILALFSMVAAYAQSGDENALQNGLRDFFLLDILATSLTGFEEGGYTGDMGTKKVAGVVHGKEYVMTASDTKKYGLVGKSGGEFGEAISDYFPTQTPTSINPFPAQEEAFKKAVAPQQNSNDGVISAVNKLSDQIAKQPNHSAQIVQLQKNMWAMNLKIQKQNMTELKQEIVRAKLGK